MKRTVKIIALLAALAALFTSCSKPLLDETGCYINLEDAKKAARKAKSNILIIISQEEGEQNGGSSYFVHNILLNENFREYCKDNFELYRMDYSQKNLLKSRIDENADEKAKKQAEQYGDLIQEGMKITSYLGTNYTPAFYIMTKDGYFVAEVEYTEDSMNVDAFSDLLDSYKSQAKYVQDLINATKKGSDTEKFTAIESLFEVTPMPGQYFLYDFAEKAIALDKNNETGKTGKYHFMIAEEKATKLFQETKYDEAINVFAELAESGVLEPESKQSAYYMCAWILESIGSMDSPLLLDYLHKAYDAAPASENAHLLEEAIEYYSVQFQMAQPENPSGDAQ